MEGLESLQELFDGKVFKIPDYQRGYSWETEHRDDLLEDLESIQDGKRHYTGTVVLRQNGFVEAPGEKYSRFDVVDGQQRITSIVILLQCIVEELRTIGNSEAKETAQTLSTRYIRQQGVQGSVYKLELDANSDMFFKEAIIQGKLGVPPKIRPHFRLAEAKKQFREYLERKKISVSDFQTFLSGLVSRITQSLAFTRYKVADDAEVGIIFEVMNDRGKPLSQLDKVKNYLLYLADKVSEDDASRHELTDKINYAWKEILQNLSDAEKSETDDEDQFLRVNYIVNYYRWMKHEKDSQGNRVSVNSQLGDIHHLVKRRLRKLEGDNTKAYQAIKRYVDSLQSMSRQMKDTMKPFDSTAFPYIPEETRKKIAQACGQLNRLERERIVLPFLLSVTERYHDEPAKLLELLRLWEILTFRIFFIGAYRPYAAESTIFRLCCNIYRGKVDYDQARKEIKRITQDYVPFEEIEAFLTDRKINYYEWSGLRYFLYEYERKRCDEETGKRPAFEWEELKGWEREESIEHILPETIYDELGNCLVKEWCDDFDEKSHKSHVNRLGNLTLTTKNSSLGNKSFDKKKEIYAKSSWQIEKDLANYAAWTSSEIAKREAELVEFAKSRWMLSEDTVTLTPKAS